jgi:predicted secreted hydrolase
LRSEAGNQYGFQLTFFRSRISPPGDEKKWPRPASAWRTPQVYAAHAAVSDIAGNKHLSAEEVSRAALGLAGVDQSAQQTTVFLKNWSTQIRADSHSLRVVAPDFSYELNFNPVKPAALHGIRGYNLRGSTPERASCYYSVTRLRGNGRINLYGKMVRVSGSAWLDHEFSSAPLEPEISGWDWFSLQFSDDTEIMVVLGRTKQGQVHTASSGTYVDSGGRTRRITKNEIKVEVLDTWKSKQSGAHYPSRWRMQIEPLALDVRIASNLPDQEMITLGSTGVIYWEGSVSIDGTKKKHRIQGEGYAELTGYAADFDAPL